LYHATQQWVILLKAQVKEVSDCHTRQSFSQKYNTTLVQHTKLKGQKQAPNRVNKVAWKLVTGGQSFNIGSYSQICPWPLERVRVGNDIILEKEHYILNLLRVL